MDPQTLLGIVAGLVVALLVSHGLTAWGAWSARGRAADAELGRVADRLDVALDAIEVLKADAARAQFASAGLVQAERAIAEARAAGSRRDRVRGLLVPPGGGPAPGPGAAGGGAPGHVGDAGPA